MSELCGHGLEPRIHDRLEEVVPESDALYVTRVQLERIPQDQRPATIPYIVTPATMAMAKPRGEMILMHPLPRDSQDGNPEISVEVDADPRAAYFRQCEYGMYARMAILSRMLRAD